MINIERILCPTDLSADSERTLRYAVALARAYGAKLLVCHRPKSSSPEEHEGVLQTIKKLIEAGQESASEGAHEFSTLDWESVLLEGADLGAAITREAWLRGAQLILMRSRRRPFAAAVLGSTAETVSRLSPCTVLVMHADEREWLDNSTGAIALRRILVAYDFSSYSELALLYALALAGQYQAELHLLHVLPAHITGEPEIGWVGQDTNTPYHHAARRLQQAVPAEVQLWTNVKHAVQYGRPYGEVLSYAEKQEIDLISMGAHGSGYGSYALFGSNVDRVLRQARCPVLIAHPLHQADNQPAATG
jgi:nucleotide-binding universal stress UspA family protein